ncbi:hypothetical protein OPT61_g8834 [Boeremia exigua]|uniref:Uncharacterized protein n=1 Tax=Boeremia exigua TaxID=749465 RepID=A0ACC2HWY5_9PLEO|nr:hypothetical protein OPT61_g8834 [Boeremia exigua]
MAISHDARHTARSNASGRAPLHISSANSTQLGSRDRHTPRGRDDDRARRTQRKRDNRECRNKISVPRNSGPTVVPMHLSRLTDRMTYNNATETGVIGSLHGASQPARTHQDRSRSADGSPLQPISLCDGQETEDEHVKYDVSDNIVVVDRYADLFGSELPQPRPYQLTASSAVGLSATRQVTEPKPKKHPVNPYRGADPIKRRVQNPKLQRILSGKPMAKPRKHPDRMVLGCIGKREIR